MSYWKGLDLNLLSASGTVVTAMSNPSTRPNKSPSPAPTAFPGELSDLVAQLAEEENVLPTSEEVLRRGFDWKTITGVYGGDNLQGDFETIRKFDHKRTDPVAVALKNPGYAKSFLTVLSKVQNRDVRQYILALLDRMLQDIPNFARDLWQLNGTKLEDSHPLPLGPLLALLRFQDDDLRKSAAPALGEDGQSLYRSALFIAAKTCAIVTNLFMNVEIPQVDQQVFIPWLKQQCEKSSPAERMIGLQALHQLLTVNDYKLIFWHLQGVEVLQHLAVAPKVDGPKHTQQLYLAVKCLWLLSYHEDIKIALNSPVMISNLVEILKSVSKDKIVRLTLSTLRNLMDIGKNAELMISYGIIRCLNLFLQKRWADEDIDADLAALQTYLEDKVNDLTSFDVYKYELLGMKLDWSSPVHRSERFWRTNVNRFDEDDYAALKQLRLILTSPDSSATVLAVASWDVGEIIRQHPQRKFVLQKVDLKTPVMALLHHPSEEVKKESLLALQKIMVTNWESLQ